MIDSRDVIARIEELAALMDSGSADSDELSELQALEALEEQCKGYAADWEYGESLIRESYFKEYAEELASDIGAISRYAKWPLNCIDWDQAAEELKHDYTSVEFDGVTYYIR